MFCDIARNRSDDRTTRDGRREGILLPRSLSDRISHELSAILSSFHTGGPRSVVASPQDFSDVSQADQTSLHCVGCSIARFLSRIPATLREDEQQRIAGLAQISQLCFPEPFS